MISQKVIALAGNPNVGKSTVFNSLTNLHQHTGNWPGKTVSIARGSFDTAHFSCQLVDLPGTYSLLPHSAEEEITGTFLQSGEADAVIVVCDATCLEHNLLLVLQVCSCCPKVLLCINLMDEAAKKGIHIDLALLEKLLDIPVAGTAARQKNGLGALTAKLDMLLMQAPVPAPLPSSEEACENHLQTLAETASSICSQVISFENADYRKRDRKLDRILTGKYTGFPVMLLLLAVVFWITIAGANYPSSLLSRLLFSLEDPLAALCTRLRVSPILTDLLVRGMYRVLAWVVSVMLPPMAIFFPLFTLLEDVGYLPRIAYNLDYCFQKCRACGKQALTMAMGFGCNCVGVLGCRIIDSPRERLIAILTNSFVPCNGRFPTLITIISLYFISAAGAVSVSGSPSSGNGLVHSLAAALCLTLFILLSVLMTFAASKLLSATVLKGVPSSFTLELPPYRMPQVGKVIVRSLLDRTVFVLGRAVFVAIPAGALIWCAANVTVGSRSLLSCLAGALDPFARLLGLDGTILLSFMLGMPANEIVMPIMLMAYLQQGSLTEINDLNLLHTLLAQNGWTIRTAVCTCLFSLFHWPCATTLLTIRRETGSLKWTAAAFLLPTLFGLLLCMAVNGAMLLLCHL